MIRKRVGVAISTTGHEHRLGFLETCVAHWDKALGPGDSLFVTVDGNATDTARAAEAVREYTESVFQVGQFMRPVSENLAELKARATQPTRRLGVSVNKNTGLELLMNNTSADHLFLSDDDAWPLYPQSLRKHTDLPIGHSMVVWGKSRLVSVSDPYAHWSWPRGVVLYQARAVVDRVGGMDERFGPGGHEHAEYSQRICNAGFTPTPFITPASYATRNGKGAGALWHCEDMAKPGETLQALGRRRKELTTIRRARDWEHINKIMAEREGDSSFVPYEASANGRASATLSSNLTSRGADK
jgi:hypothetical protein